MKLLSVHQLVAFKFMSLNTINNLVNLIEPTYNEVSTSVDIVSCTCTWTKALVPTSRIMSFNLSSSSRSSTVEFTTFSILGTVGKSINLSCHIHVVQLRRKPSQLRYSLLVVAFNFLLFKQLTQGHLNFTSSSLLSSLHCTNCINSSIPFSYSTLMRGELLNPISTYTYIY